jgi:uncharacterized protein YjiS (DUF1127 family)
MIAARDAAGLGRKALTLTWRAWSAYWARRTEHATVAILHALDDRALKDLGLDRSEIESVVYGERGCRGARRRPGVQTPLRERRVRVCH